jgi:hypothetical protein
MHPCRHPPAPPAPRAARPWMRGDHQRCVDAVDVVDHHRRQMREQNPATTLTSHNPRAPRPARRHHGKCARTIKRGRRQRRAWRPVNPGTCSTTCMRCSRRRRRKTGAPSTTPPPVAPKREDRPPAAGGGYGPVSIPVRTGGTATHVTVDARRSSPRHRPDRCGRSLQVTDVEAGLGNSIHQPQTQSTTPTCVRTAIAGVTKCVPEPDTATSDSQCCRRTRCVTGSWSRGWVIG